MKLDYKLLQSTDDGAFTLLTSFNRSSPSPAQPIASLSAQPSENEAAKRREVRKLVLEAVQSRAQAKDGSGRMKGKVGVITGVGPEKGIGVNCVLLLALDRPDLPYRQRPQSSSLKKVSDSFPMSPIH